jgi:glycosyltransferase involved in cell wall biosynthesis
LFGKRFVFDHHDLSPELYRSRFGTNASGWVSHVLQLLEAGSVRLASVVIATNSSYRDIDVQRHSIDPSKIFIVRNGPDLKRVRLVEPDERLRAMGRTILGYVGAMNPQDGVDYLLRAVHYLLNDLKRSDFYCVLIGEGDSKPELEALARALGLDDHVWFTGFVSDEQMIRYLSTADICLDPNPSSPLNDVSTWIKVMEYMALGKPVVSFDLKETRTSAREAAVYVQPNDEAAFGKAVLDLMNDPARRIRMGEAGQSRVQRELNWSITSRNLLSAYNYLFQRRSQLAEGTTAVSALPPESPEGAVQASPSARLAAARMPRESDIQ